MFDKIKAGTVRFPGQREPMHIGIIILSALLFIYGVLAIFPFIFMLSSSFKPLGQVFDYPFKLIPETFTFQNYLGLFSSRYSFVRWYWNTIVMEVYTIAIKTYIVGMAAYAFARLRFKGRDFIFLILLSAMMIPPDVTLIPKYVIFKFINITDTVWSLVLPYTFDVFFVFMLRQFFVSIPTSLSESAMIDGASHIRIYRQIIMPLAKPAFMTMILFTFVWAWNDFITPYIFITNTDKQMLSVGISLFQDLFITNYAMQMAAATLVLLPVIAMFLFAQKFFIEGIAGTGIKG